MADKPEKIEETTIAPVEEKPEKPDLNTVDPNELDLDEIEALEKAETEDKPEGEKPENKPEEEKPAEDSSEEVKKEKPEEKGGEEEVTEITPDTDPKELKRIEDLRRLVSTAQMEAGNLRKQLNETKAKLRETEKSSFELLDEDSEAELKKEDPDAYYEYIKAKDEYEKKVEKAESDALNDAILVQAAEVKAFTLNRFGIEVDLTIPPEKQPPEVQELIKDGGKLRQLDEYLQKNIIAHDGIHTAKQMEDAYKILFHDEILAESRKGIREETLDKIEEAARGGSVLDKAASDSPSKTTKKNIDDYTQKDISEMSEAECDRILETI